LGASFKSKTAARVQQKERRKQQEGRDVPVDVVVAVGMSSIINKKIVY